MNNVTQYLKNNGIYSDYKIYNFLRLERVKYLIAQGAKVETKRGRYNSGTFFDDGLFLIFQSWLKKEPLPLLNRKEYEVQQFINELFGDEVVRQYSLDSFVYDWYVPSLNLLIEFHEKEHNHSKHIKKNDLRKMRSNLFVINEATVMNDLARLAKHCRQG
jgi:hypothetical protein